ncbi:MAG: helicase-related protein [Verrucomicrobiota bacterium]
MRLTREVAQAVDRVIEGKALSTADRALFGAKSEQIRRHCEELAAGDEKARKHLVTELLDAFGTGRVMFRNTRAALSGFPERHARLSPLKAAGDPFTVKVKWLAALLKTLDEAKVLLICRTRELAEQLSERLQREMSVSCALFHEGLTLLQRDRNAAFFAEEEGARILICSEIGSEGRNFQFAHHLVLFDLPLNPELLEQRIGRLDRIGQRMPIEIHVPYLQGTESEVLARWYHEGLNAFEKNPHGAAEIAKALEKDLNGLLETFSARKLTTFIKRSQEHQSRVAKKLERGHDRLLELNSCRPEQAAVMIKEIQARDEDDEFEEFFVRLMDHFGVHVEDLGGGNRTYLLRPGHLITDAFPSLPEEGMSVTFDRTRALSREDLGFMSGDHPLMAGALDLLLGAEAGNACFGVWKDSGKEAMMLEVYCVVECVAPAALHVDRFLPATPIRIVVNHELHDMSDDEDFKEAYLEKGDVFKLLDRGVVKKKFLPTMLEKAQALAVEKMEVIVASATAAMETQLHSEIGRLEVLREINDHVRPAEIEAVRTQKSELQAALGAARLRLDAVRLIMRNS